jgi:hypothetical protein
MFAFHNPICILLAADCEAHPLLSKSHTVRLQT